MIDGSMLQGVVQVRQSTVSDHVEIISRTESLQANMKYHRSREGNIALVLFNVKVLVFVTNLTTQTQEKNNALTKRIT